MTEDTKLTPDQTAEAEDAIENEEHILHERAKARDAAVDDGDGANGGGMGSSGSAVDFGRPKNYT